MTKSLWVYCPSPIFSNTCTFLYFCILSHLFSFWNHFPPPLLFPSFFSSPSLYFHKPYPQSKTFINIPAVSSSDAFCSNAVLITTPSSSMLFISFFDVLPSIPTTYYQYLTFFWLLSLVPGISQFFSSLFC